MMTSIFTPQKKTIAIISKESPREQRMWRAKYNRFMHSRRVLIWAR